jgi:hypothetical protein
MADALPAEQAEALQERLADYNKRSLEALSSALLNPAPSTPARWGGIAPAQRAADALDAAARASRPRRRRPRPSPTRTRTATPPRRRPAASPAC